jgi:hypothetical protein
MLSAARVPAELGSAQAEASRGYVLFMQLQGVLFHAFSLKLTRQQKRCLGRIPRRSMVKETFSGWIRLALALPLCGIVRAPLTMTGKEAVIFKLRHQRKS